MDKFQAITLAREIVGAAYDKHPDLSSYVATVSLNQRLDNLDDLTTFCVRQQVPLKDCSIHLCATPVIGVDTFTAPTFINKVLKHIDCQITFSVGAP